MRYIDADALLERLKKQYGEELGWQCTVNMSDVGMMIEDATTADVVPKSEVERLEHLRAELSKEVADLQDALKREKETNEHLNDEYISLMKENEKLTINMNAYGLTVKRLAEEKAEVAREIFAEIDNKIGIGHDVIDIFDILAKLKKKYIPQDCPN